MKNMISFIIQSTAIFTLLMLSSCGSAIDSIDPDRCDNLQAVAQGFIDAAVVYSQDPSLENCKTYKTALEDYLELIQDCSLSSGVGVQETQDSIDSLDC